MTEPSELPGTREAETSSSPEARDREASGRPVGPGASPPDRPGGVEATEARADSEAPGAPPATEGAKAKKGDRKKKKKDKKDKDGLGTSRGIETMFRTSYRTHMDLSSLADTKANIMISINGIIMSIILASVSPKIDSNPFLLFPTSVLLLACLVSMVYAILAARPRVSSRLISLEDVRRNRANILFFGNFVQLSEDDFVTGMSELLQNQDGVYTNMIRDIYSLGAVLQRKFALLRTSYTVFMYGLVAGVVLFLAVFLGVVMGVVPSSPQGLGL